MASHQYAASIALEVKDDGRGAASCSASKLAGIGYNVSVAHVYVTGHRNPDLDSIGSAIGLAELMGRLHPGDTYTPVRLGDANRQTEWALERSGAKLPEFLPHIRLRVSDVMKELEVVANRSDPVRQVGREMAEHGMDLMPVVDDAGKLTGMVTERDLARLYVRESRGVPTFADAPARVSTIVEVLQGELVAGDGDTMITGRLWVISMDVATMGRNIEPGDIVVVGDRTDAQLQAIELGCAAMVTSNGIEPDPDALALAQERGTIVIVSPSDSYVTSRMIRLSEPCSVVVSSDPLTVAPEDVLGEVSSQVLDVDYRAAIAVDEQGIPIALVTRGELVRPTPRRVLLVDHAEQAQSVPGIEEAEIVEILDHHHIGSIETRVPVRATFDPVGSTATLVVERFRAEGREPRAATAGMLLAAILSDTVILSSPTTTDRDRRVVNYLEELLQLDAREFGMEMFEYSSDVSDLSGEEIVTRDAKEYEVGGRTVSIAQVETVGKTLSDRESELRDALETARRMEGHDLTALMVTDIVSRGTRLLVAGDPAPLARILGVDPDGGIFDLPGVMSRKKQVAPRIMAALG
jgi:manganese-dependent inorganic pyrophosphatase